MAAAEHAAQKHPYHLVDPSVWPLVGSIGGVALAFGAALFMHPDMFGAAHKDSIAALGPWKVAPGLLIILTTMWFWWKDVIRESRTYHTPVVQLGLRYGMILFITSEVFFFLAFFWAFFDASLYPGAANMPGRVEATGGVWPPKGIHPFDPFDLPLMNTLILLTSGTTVTWAHHAILEGDQKNAVRGLLLTVVLGAFFTCVQAYEYAHAAFGFREGIYPSVFYMATGFHGFHVIVGTIFLTVCLFRAMKGHFKPDHHFGFEAAAWYWHFVDVVWLFLFFAIYWWGKGNAAIAVH
ncbi:cytochrome c oxidase subunit 3 [Vineibacter terrae]|uniref:cytochrome c oxidase subunit 3 n=1 Tax=Vineibacter terrae TaxID=2586908 RepID=UPI002E362749|nr:cytochrome c oxidase subunit 3 [Vineibacter terrae]HEX2890187.1 cytochrome c oxidase subunit 3 [Vineibacter terrae]